MIVLSFRTMLCRGFFHEKALSILAFLLFTVFLVPHESACGPDDSCSSQKWGYAGHEFDVYDVTHTSKTPKGISFDSSGMHISGELIDRLTDEVETCLNGFAGTLPEDVSRASGCPTTTLNPIDRSRFVVKVASNWQLNCDRTEQVLPVLAGGAGCVAKGLVPTQSCPCRWRAGIKCPNVLIVTPSFFLYKDVLIRYITGCINPWASPALAECATPTTQPLNY